jgi:PAS domain S-box-containing protein
MRNRALKYTLAFAVIAFVISLLIAYVQRNTVNTYEYNLPYLTLGDNIKNRTTTAHLWFEELMAGDASREFQRDVIQPLSTCRAILQSAYDGKKNELGNFAKPVDEDTKAFLKEAVVSIDKLIEAATERNAMAQAVAPTVVSMDDINSSVSDSTLSFPLATTAESNTAVAGGDLDQKFDESFSAFQRKMDELIEHVNKNVKSDSAYLNIFSWVSIGLLVFIFITLAILLYRLQLGNDQMTNESKLRIEQQGRAVSSLTNFIEAISSGNYGVEVQIENDASNLRETLMTMRDKLHSNADEDRKRNWSTTGLAQIGEILRTPTSTTEELLDNIVKFVVKYTKSNQAGLFILNEDSENDHFLELMACYAFERKKYLTKKITIGEGLIGQCFLEGEKMYLVEVPKEYVSITSGLGGSNPNALLIVPLKVNEKVYGVIELATFGEYQDYEIDLVSKLAESIASTISTVRVNESTRILLEKTQQQAEEMRAQEEEMRQNMEELEATQEEMRRKEKHIQNMLDGEKARNEIAQKNRKVLMELTKNNDIQSGNLNSALERITTTIGQQLNVSRSGIWSLSATRNKITCDKLFQLRTRTYDSKIELLGKEAPDFFEAITREEVLAVKDASTHPATKDLGDNYLQPNNVRSLLVVPFFSEGRLSGIICCEQQGDPKDWTEEDIEFLKACADLVTVTHNTSKINRMLEQVNDSQETMQTIIDNIPRAVFWKDKDLKFLGCNRIFANIAGFRSTRDLMGKTDFDMPWKEHADAYRADDQAIMKSRKSRLDHEERNVNAEGKESWVLTSKVPVTNHHGEVVAVLGMFEDITERKHRDAEVQARLKELDELKKRLAKES